MDAQRVIPIIRPTLVDFGEVEEAFREVWNSGLVTVGKYTAQFEEAVNHPNAIGTTGACSPNRKGARNASY